jgi:hypothetical protein
MPVVILVGFAAIETDQFENAQDAIRQIDEAAQAGAWVAIQDNGNSWAMENAPVMSVLSSGTSGPYYVRIDHIRLVADTTG